mgnify:CR=1 FL=1
MYSLKTYEMISWFFLLETFWTIRPLKKVGETAKMIIEMRQM